MSRQSRGLEYVNRLVDEQMCLNAAKLNAISEHPPASRPQQLAWPWYAPPPPQPEPEPEEPLTLEEYLDENADEVEDAETLVALLHGQEGVRQGSFPSGIRFVVAGIKKKSWEQTEPEHLFIEQKDGTWSHESPQHFVENISWSDNTNHYLIAPGGEDPELRFNREFWEAPATLYHGTSDLPGVLRTGIGARSRSRGLGNRSVGAAVFTSLRVEGTESYASGPDGGTVEIDTEAMKRDGVTPFTAQEPEVVEQEMLNAIAHGIGIEHVIEYGDAGIDPDTIILYGHVPVRYLKVVS